MQRNILVLLPVEARHKEKLEAAGTGCSFVYSDPDTVTASAERSSQFSTRTQPRASPTRTVRM